MTGSGTSGVQCLHPKSGSKALSAVFPLVLLLFSGFPQNPKWLPTFYTLHPSNIAMSREILLCSRARYSFIKNLQRQISFRVSGGSYIFLIVEVVNILVL
jgi:hypothetical protein